MQVVDDQDLKGGVTLNFAFDNDVLTKNQLDINGQDCGFIAKFRFSKKSKLLVPLLSTNTVADLLEYVVAKLNIIIQEEGKIKVFEREVSASQQDIFYREMQLDEQPLETFVLWKLNKETKGLVLTDHDPNKKKYRQAYHIQPKNGV